MERRTARVEYCMFAGGNIHLRTRNEREVGKKMLEIKKRGKW